MKKNYKVSVIIPVYNTERYLRDTVNSLINQKYNFSDIEVILVNDGSTDHSLDICNEYSSKYDNVTTINKKNSGVSDTRNQGFAKSHGEYIMFLDSDDLLNRDSLKYLVKFLDEHSEVDFVISRVRHFEGSDCWHFMDFRFKTNKDVIDVNENIRYTQYHSTGILIRRKAIENNKFDKNIKFGEDMKFMFNILINNNLIGIEKRSILFYRVRGNATSAVQGQTNDKRYYNTILKEVFMYIIDKCLEKYGNVPKYFQFFILHSLTERFNKPMNFDVLTKEEYNEYIDLFKKIVSYMDDDVIMKQTRIGINNKYDLLKMKYGKLDYEYKDKKIIINDESYPIGNGEFVKVVDLINIDKKVVLYIALNDYLFKNKIKVLINGEEAKLFEWKDSTYKAKEYKDMYSKVFYTDKLVYIEYELDKLNDIRFKIDFEYVPFSLVNEYLGLNRNKFRYLRFNDVLINFREGKGEIVFRKQSNKLRDLKYNIFNYRNFYTKGDCYTMKVKNGKIIKRRKKYR